MHVCVYIYIYMYVYIHMQTYFEAKAGLQRHCGLDPDPGAKILIFIGRWVKQKALI